METLGPTRPEPFRSSEVWGLGADHQTLIPPSALLRAMRGNRNIPRTQTSLNFSSVVEMTWGTRKYERTGSIRGSPSDKKWNKYRLNTGPTHDITWNLSNHHTSEIGQNVNEGKETEKKETATERITLLLHTIHKHKPFISTRTHRIYYVINI